MINKYKSARPEYWTTYTDTTMWKQFFKDLESANHRLIIQSAFIGINRMKDYWAPLRRCVRRNVSVCVFLQQPERWNGPDAPPVSNFEALAEGLENEGVHVTLKPEIHEKLMVVDESVLWDGSLNYLSHTRSKDRIHRFANTEVIYEAIETHNLLSCEICISNASKSFATGDASAVLEALKSYREKARISQKDMAALCNRTQGWISKLESGRHTSLPLDEICRLASKSNCTPVLIPNYLKPQLLQFLVKYHEIADKGSVGNRQVS